MRKLLLLCSFLATWMMFPQVVFAEGDTIQINGVYINGTSVPVRSESVIALSKEYKFFHINFEVNEGVEISQQGVLPFEGEEQEYTFEFRKDGKIKKMHIKFVRKEDEDEEVESTYVFPLWARVAYFVIGGGAFLIWVLHPNKKEKATEENKKRDRK